MTRLISLRCLYIIWNQAIYLILSKFLRVLPKPYNMSLVSEQISNRNTANVDAMEHSTEDKGYRWLIRNFTPS